MFSRPAVLGADDNGVTPSSLVDAVRGFRRTLATGLLGAATTYLVLDRSHAEEIGGGARVVAEVVRGERPLTAATWLVLAAAGTVTLAARCGRPQVRARARGAS